MWRFAQVTVTIRETSVAVQNPTKFGKSLQLMLLPTVYDLAFEHPSCFSEIVGLSKLNIGIHLVAKQILSHIIDATILTGLEKRRVCSLLSYP